MRNKNNGKTASRVRRYNGIMTFRAVVLGLVLAPALVTGILYVVHRGGGNQEQLSDWAAAPAFAIDSTPEELAQAFADATTAFGTTYVERELLVKKVANLKAEYSRGFMSRASLDQALTDLISECDDRYVRLLSSQEYEDLFIRLGGKRVGIQLSFKYQPETDSYVVDDVGPVADQAGIQKGDAFVAIYVANQIFHVDFLKKAGLAQHEIPEVIDSALQRGGRLGSEAHLTLRRGADIYDFYVERTIIGEEDAVTVSDISIDKHKYGPEPDKAKEITVTFMGADDFVKKFREKLDEVLATEGLKGIGLDLSATIGGTREVAVQMAALFMKSGVITHEIRPVGDNGIEMVTYFVRNGRVHITTKGPYVRDRSGKLMMVPGGQEKEVVTDWQAGLWTGDLVLAISENTRGSGEIVASALKGDHRAVVTGSNLSFGKGMNQTFIRVSTDRYISLSSSVFLQPDGSSLERHGVIPNMPNQAASSFAIQQAMQQQFSIVPFPEMPAAFAK